MTTFAWDGRHLKDVAAFEAYLATLPPPTWARGATIHHTYSPTVEQWRGEKTFTGIKRYYEGDVKNPDGSRGWPAGPHVFNAPDGIWIGTPPTTKGVHAGIYNSIFWGIETVGNYDKGPFTPFLKEQLYGIVVALFRWKGITTVSLDTVRGHRECNSPKSCPGWGNDMKVIRTELAERLHRAMPCDHPHITRCKIVSDDGWAAVRIAPDLKAPRALNGTAKLPAGMIVDIDAFVNGWGHLAETNPFRDLGFIHESLLKPEGGAA